MRKQIYSHEVTAANENNPMNQSIPDGQNQVLSYISSCSGSHFTGIYITIRKEKMVVTPV